MSVFTELSFEQLAAWLLKHTGQALLSYQGITEGASNSNFFVESAEQRWVLTLQETGEAHAFLQSLQLQQQLFRNGLAVPEPFLLSGQLTRPLAGKPACLVTCLKGKTLAPDLHRSLQAADFLARLHQETAAVIAANPHRADWFIQSFKQLTPLLTKEQASLFSAALKLIKPLYQQDQPLVINHADLFSDNLLFDGQNLSGVIDWHFSCLAPKEWDLAITINAWFGDAALNSEPVKKFLQTYQQAGGLHTEQLDLWRIAAALRFWISRLQAQQNNDLQNVQVTTKAPEQLENLLLSLMHNVTGKFHGNCYA